MHATLTWSGGMAFRAEADGHSFPVDASADVGGEDTGPRPKSLLLTALAGCTAMDVVAILDKMRLVPNSMVVEARAEIRDEHPRVFTGITLLYRLSGDLPPDRVVRAIQLSQDKYCSVTAMLRPAVPIAWELWLDGEQIVPAAA